MFATMMMMMKKRRTDTADEPGVGEVDVGEGREQGEVDAVRDEAQHEVEDGQVLEDHQQHVKHRHADDDPPDDLLRQHRVLLHPFRQVVQATRCTAKKFFFSISINCKIFHL